ncbi:hypothetical protein LXL04_015167 [Taraxacum kok-saghyz]
MVVSSRFWVDFGFVAGFVVGNFVGAFGSSCNLEDSPYLVGYGNFVVKKWVDLEPHDKMIGVVVGGFEEKRCKKENYQGTGFIPDRKRLTAIMQRTHLALNSPTDIPYKTLQYQLLDFVFNWDLCIRKNNDHTTQFLRTPLLIPFDSPSLSKSRIAFTASSSLRKQSKSFENSYIPENPRTPKPLTFSKNRLRGAKNRSNIRPVAKFFFRKNDFFFPKTLHMFKLFFVHMSLYNTYLKSCTYAQKIKKSCTYAKVKKKYRFFGNFFQRIVMIKNVLEGSEVGFLKGITVWEI